ncbi:heterokaryon incompatibility protein-domain-containing protein [Annulohypoxylon truncatum]|uniref:heterokaryon incompatibility protein-domain-containing protein n=1 Tax=Annulohypoxylon truncatum TaxID=327061 RepID=UPI0020076E3A|nr:heterokaryon incompatibility protein-domain-containing protein [Annulohypoxylon truncatum]KAI1207484.1 heterokaryon incompatibility protein-domain-containing protein [Annulohypoxylon truncatum]
MTNLTIIEEGRRWIASVKRSDRLEVGECCPRQAYIELQVPKRTSSVTRVTISTVSHDQGWSDESARYGGTYEGSQTYFDLAVETPTCHERVGSFIFQRNLHARGEPHRHENVWDVESDDKARCAWLQVVQGGDTIRIFPMAQLQLWTNYVYEVEMKVEGGFKDQEDHLPNEVTHLQDSTGVDRLEVYKPLQEAHRQTRVLSLYPGKFEDPLVCSITNISLDDPSHDAYEALSYCWGDLRTEEIIQIRESLDNFERLTHNMAITSNLYEALKHLRPESGLPRKLWVDAICIDQANSTERSHQVASMPYIYAEAIGVVVWLGTSVDLPIRRKCFSALQKIQERFQTEYDQSRTYSPEEREQFELKIINTEIPDLIIYTIDWNKCGFDYFKRTWVLQEISNSRTAVFRCGFDDVTWPVVSSAIRFLQTERLGTALVKAGSQPAGVLRTSIAPSIWFSIVQLGEEKQGAQLKAAEGILEILVKAHSLKATDLRDKLFALLQFSKESKDAMLSPYVRVDYSKSPVKVFTDFVRWWICTHRSLRILSAIHTMKYRGWQQMYCGEPPDLGTLEYPSWCFWPVGDDRMANSTLGLSLDGPYQASGSTIPDVELINSPDTLVNPHILQLTGHRLSTISKIDRFPIWEFPDLPIELRDAFMKVFDPANYGRFVLPGQSYQDSDEIKESVRNFLTRHYLYHSHGFKGETPYIPCLSPSFFVAKELGEKCYGLCPHNARPGDIVVVLYGGPVFYLLREAKQDPGDGENDNGAITSEKKYQFVGECFLFSYMNGQALATVQEKGIEKEIFSLV